MTGEQSFVEFARANKLAITMVPVEDTTIMIYDVYCMLNKSLKIAYDQGLPINMMRFVFQNGKLVLMHALYEDPKVTPNESKQVRNEEQTAV